MVGDYGLTEAEQQRGPRPPPRRPGVGGERQQERSAGGCAPSVGQRVAWRREIEEQEGTAVIAPEWDYRRDLG